jgi:hypothetical protein
MAKEKEKPIYKKLWFWAAALIVLSVVYTIPVLVMNSFKHISLSGPEYIEYNTVGTIGDSFGIVAPFINLVAAVFVFLAFREQMEANRMLQRQLDEEKDVIRIQKVDEIYRKYLERIEEEIDVISYERGGRRYRGYDAIQEILKDMGGMNCPKQHTEHSPEYDVIYNTFELHVAICEFEKDSDVSELEKKFTGALLQRSISRLGDSFKEANEYLRKYPCRVCNFPHKFPNYVMGAMYALNSRGSGFGLTISQIINEWKEYMDNEILIKTPEAKKPIPEGRV